MQSLIIDWKNVSYDENDKKVTCFWYIVLTIITKKTDGDVCYGSLHIRYIKVKLWMHTQKSNLLLQNDDLYKNKCLSVLIVTELEHYWLKFNIFVESMITFKHKSETKYNVI
jgi:hypothetical protein